MRALQLGAWCQPDNQTSHMVRPDLLSVIGAVGLGVAIALEMIRDEPDPPDAAGERGICPSPLQKVTSGPAVIIVLFLAVTIYLAVRYLPVWP